MIITRYSPDSMNRALGFDMSTIGTATRSRIDITTSYVRITPGSHSDLDRHDESEVFVFVSGHGVVTVDGERHPVGPGTVITFEPFETHLIENTGDVDLVMVDAYWRDAAAAADRSGRSVAHQRLDSRPVFVFSTPPTPNGDLHLGHLSGPYLGADVMVRFLRMNGTQAWHLTGSDDHQSYVVDRARRDGSTPASVAARFSAEIRATLSLMDISVDQFTVTQGDQEYAAGLRAFFHRLVDSGRVRAEPLEGTVGSDGSYLYEVDVQGGCPGCGTGTNGNICEECGEPNICTDLVAPVSKHDGLPAQRGPVERFVLPLHEFAAEVADHQRLGRTPARLRELAARLFARPRVDIPVTHPAGWGVVPEAADSDPAGVRDQVIWVWPEMAYGFLYGIERLGERLEQGWRSVDPQADWKIVHFFGYDNSFYHSILYPVLYQLAFPEWRPSIDYHLNEFYLLDGEKFSTSRRHAVWGKEVLNPDTVDGIRFHLSRTRPETARTNFTRAALASSMSEVLVGRWQSWLDGVGARVDQEHGGHAPDAGAWTPEHVGFLARLGVRLGSLSAALSPSAFSLNAAADELDGLVQDALRFAAAQAPVDGLEEWRSESRTTTALQLAAVRLLATTAAPVMPRFAARLAETIGLAPPDSWPSHVELLAPGSAVTLTGVRFFDAADHRSEAPARTPTA